MSNRQSRSGGEGGRGDYYEILNSTPNATFDELKSNYKQLILQCHPDKLQHGMKIEAADASSSSSSAQACVDPNIVAAYDNTEFVIINEAWNTLKDPVKRKHYDAELLLSKFQMHSNIFERITLDDMTTIENEVDEVEVKNAGQEGEEGEIEDNVETYYTYNCRCGGQYIIDESAARDNGIHKGTKPANDNDNKNAAYIPTTHNNDCANTSQQHQKQQQHKFIGDVDDKDKTADGEVMVECSECSLVIILSNAPKCTPTS